MYVVETGSMAPTFNAGDVVIDRTAKGGYEAGDVLTVQISAAGDLVTHRMTRRGRAGLSCTPRATPTRSRTPGPCPHRVRARCRQARVPNLGYLVVFMRQKEGIAG